MLPVLVGREGVLAVVTQALRDGPSLVLIEGEAGIGKTRLVSECLRSPGIVDRPVLMSVCPPLNRPFPLGAVVDGVRRLRPELAALGLSPLAGALRPLFPEWGDQLPPALEPLDDPRETRHRLLRALTELAERLGTDVLVVEDAHWADAATLEWLLSFTTSGNCALSVVVTFRPTDVPGRSLLRRLTSRPPGGMGRVRIELQPLDVGQTRQMVRSMLGADDVSEQFAAFLHDRTDGIPLAVEETIRLMRERADVIRRDGSWSRKVLDELDVPRTVRDSVLDRVERLDHTAQQVLRAAAVLAEPADDALLSAVAGADEEEGRCGIAHALSAGLLRETDDAQLAFRHVMDAKAVEESMPAIERRTLHGRAARALRKLDPEPVARLARHSREANDTESWCRYAEAAADLAMESGDDRTAVVTLLDLLTTVDHPITRRLRLARRLGEAANLDSAAPDDLQDRIVEVLEHIVATSGLGRAERGEIRVLLGRTLWAADRMPAAYEAFEAAIPDLDDRPDLAIVAMLNLALPVARTWPAERHIHWLEQATALTGQAGSAADRLKLAETTATMRLLLGDERGWEGVAEIDNHPTTPTGRRLVATRLLNRSYAATVWGRYDVARRQLVTAAACIDASGYLRRMSRSQRLATAQLDYYTGCWAGLRAVAARLLEDEDTELLLSDRLQARLIHGLLTLAGDATAAAGSDLREAADGFARHGLAEPLAMSASAGLARMYLASGAAQKALDVTGPAVETIARKGVWLWATDLAPVHVDALLLAGRLDQARDFVPDLASGLARCPAPAPAAALVTCRAALAETDRSQIRAAGLFADAATAWAALPRPYDELLVMERQARCLLSASQQEAGLAVLSEAHQRLRDLGARRDADRVAHRLRKHGVKVPHTWRRGRRGYGGELSPRELEVVDLVARGMTNRQVGQALFISPKTVERHLRAAMRKLEVTGRAAVAAAASEAGLLTPANSSHPE